MSKPQITIKDIARELGVSPSTVSRALKDNPDIKVTFANAGSEFTLRDNPTGAPVRSHNDYAIIER